MNFPFFKKKEIDLAEVRVSSATTITNNKKNFLVKAVGLLTNKGSSRNEVFEEAETNLEEIKRACDTDSYVKASIMKYSYLLYKAGYTLKSENDKAVEYIKNRFNVMSYVTGKPMNILFQEIGDDIIKYSNAFLIKTRVDNVGFGIKANGIDDSRKPIGGYFRADPTHMRIKRDQHGTILSYEQYTDDGILKKFSPSEVIHFYLDKEANNAFGTPRITSALEDVRLLRLIEGHIASLIHRNTMPVFQWKIGIPEVGQTASQAEIDNAKREVENMATDGIIFTNERVEIKAIGADGKALDVTNYLKYFEERVFTALGVSDSQMGRGNSNQNADSMESQAHDTIKHIQSVLRIFIESYMLTELLLEGGFNPITNEKDFVRYEFNEISLDTKVKLENHEMLKYQSNLITLDEARTNIGLDNNYDESKLYSNFITVKAVMDQQDNQNKNDIKLAEINGEISLNQTKEQNKNSNNTNESNNKNNTSKKNGKSGNNGQKSVKPNDDVSTRNRPKNQYGTYSAKIKESYIDPNSTTYRESSARQSYSRVFQLYDKLADTLAETVNTKKQRDKVLNEYKEKILEEVKTLIAKRVYDGCSSATNELDHNKFKKVNTYNIDTFVLESLAEESIENVFNVIKDNIGLDCSMDNVSNVFNKYEYKLRFSLEFILPKSYWYAYAKTGLLYGKKYVYVKFNKDSKDKYSHKQTLTIVNLKLEDIPSFHSYCKCKLSFSK